MNRQDAETATVEGNSARRVVRVGILDGARRAGDRRHLAAAAPFRPRAARPALPNHAESP